MIIFMVVTAGVIFLGVNKGIESFSKVLMPILIILVLGIAIFSITISYTDAEGVTRTGWEGLKIYLIPNFEGMTVKGFFTVLLDAMGQMFYSLSVAMGIMIAYGSYVKDTDNLDLEFLLSILWRFPAKDLAIIRQDYETIISKIKAGKAHELSEGDTLYLGACRKGQKGDALRKQPYSIEKAVGRAFSLKPAYMRTILEWALKSGKNHLNMLEPELSSLVSAEDLQTRSFEDIVLSRFAPYIGMDYHTIAKKLKIDISNTPKNMFATIASAIACQGRAFNVNKTEEFLKAGMMMKAIRVQANGNIKEAMAFENIDYKEVYDNDEWIESRLYEIFSSRFLFVVFKEQHKGQGDYLLEKIFFWTMPQADLNVAEEYWEHIRQNVLEDHVDHEYFWKESTNMNFHVRPKGAKSSDRTANPLGEGYAPCKKFCYWFNNKYITKIVNNN